MRRRPIAVAVLSASVLCAGGYVASRFRALGGTPPSPQRQSAEVAPPPGMTRADAALAQTISPDPPAKAWSASAESYVYLPTETPRVYVSGKGGASVSVTLTPIDIRRWLTGDFANAPTGKPVATVTQKLPRVSGGYDTSLSLRLPKQKAGAYMANVRGAQGLAGSQRLLLLVSNVGLVVKTTPSDTLLVQATRLDNGQAVGGVRIETQQNDKNTSVVTDGSGFATVPLASGALPKLLGVRGANVALCYAQEPGDAAKKRTVYFQTDRPVYKPNQTAFFKAVVREDVGRGYKTLANEKVEVVVKSPDDVTLSTQTLTTNEFGSLSGEVKLPPEAALGSYPVLLRVGGEETREEIVIAEYRKPEFRATVTPRRAVTLVGESFGADVEASYYFGAPVAGAVARYYVYAQPDYLSLNTDGDAGDSDEAFPGVGPGGAASESEYGGYGEMIAQGTVITGSDGRARVSVPTRKEAVPVRYVVECHLTEASRQEVQAQGGASVLPAAVVVEATPEKYGSAPGETVNIALASADARTKAPKAARVAVVVERQTWEKLKRPDGTYRWREKIVRVVKTETQTGADGKGRFAFKPAKAGDYRVRAVVADASGRRMAAESSVWVYGERDTQQEGSFETVQLLPDKKRYAPGDTARVLIRTSQANADVWLTVEGKRVYVSKRLRLKGKSQVVSLPLPDDYAPGVYVSASYVNGKQLLRQEAMLPVSPRGHLLKVAVQSDEAQYQPGETARYTVRTTDLAGKPVSSEVALGVVDASLYAVRADQTPDIRQFFWTPRSNRVATAFSFASQYAGGPPKEASNLRAVARQLPGEKKIRSVFKDTAYWAPAVVTDGSGIATVNVALPDNLTTWRTTARAITSNTSVGWGTQEALARKDLIARLAVPRFLTQGDKVIISGIVHNFTGRTVTANVTLKAKGAGLGLNANGARTVVTLAPNAEKRIDWPVVGAGVGATELTLEADAGGGGSSGYDGMTLSVATLPRGLPKTVASSGELGKGGVTKTFALPQGRTAFRDDLRVQVAPSLVSAALGGGEELAQYPYGCIEQTLSRFVPDLVLERLLKEKRAVPSPRFADLPKMAQTGLARVYDLQNEEGGWAFSSSYTDVYFTAVAVEALHLARASGYAVNDRVQARGVQALRKATGALAVDVPKKWPAKWSKAKRANVTAVTRRALHDKARALCALALVEPKATRPGLSTLFKRRTELDDIALAHLTRGLALAGDKPKAQITAGLLRKRARVSPTGATWRAASEYAYLEQDTLATAEVVRALVAVKPSDPLIGRAFRSLMAARRGRAWHSTNDSAAVLYAVAEYERAARPNGSASAPRGARILVNGKPVKEVRFTNADLFAPETSVTLDPALLRGGGLNSVRVEPIGGAPGAKTDPVYYALALRYFAPLPASGRAEPVVAGVRVERTYLKRVPKVKPKAGPQNENSEYFDYWGDDNWTNVPFAGRAKPGDEIVVKLVVTSASDIGYALIEDPFPAGCEPADQVDADQSGYDEYSESPNWGRREMHNDRVCYLGERLPKGKTVITYRLRATTPGVFAASPSRAFAMYAPDIRGSGTGSLMTITDPPAPAKPKPSARLARVAQR